MGHPRLSNEGGGFVGVELGDFRRVFLDDDAAAEFHAGGEFAGVDGPFVGDEAEALDGFEIGEVAVDAVDERLVFGADLRVGATRSERDAVAMPRSRAQGSRAAKLGAMSAAANLWRSPTMATLATRKLDLSLFSMGWGAMNLPPQVLSNSFLRSVM